MTSPFNWDTGEPSAFARDRRNSRTTKDGRTISQVAAESIDRRRATGANPGLIPGMKRTPGTLPPRVGGRVRG